jgi:hypothetical protein
MDMWKFYDITHRKHAVCNPMSLGKLDRLIELLHLAPGSRMVEIAFGKGEILVRLVETYGAAAVGVDISPYFVASARVKLAERVPDADVVLHEMDGAEFTPEEPPSFDLGLCLGASWIFNGHEGTLKAMAGMVVPGGWVVVGEPYWRQDPSEGYLEASGDRADSFGTHETNVATGEDLGLRLEYTLVSNEDEWDEYEGLQWYAAESYARSHPDDPDVPEVLKRVADQKSTYLKWGRDTLGWAIYAFRKPERR